MIEKLISDKRLECLFLLLLTMQYNDLISTNRSSDSKDGHLLKFSVFLLYRSTLLHSC